MDSSLEDHGVRTLTHTKSGSLCHVHDFGATVICFHPNPDKYSEVLFMSREAVLNGTKAIRGGIPICFPIFGPPSGDDDSDMPQHGFARKNFWLYDKNSVTDSDESASMSFHLVVDSTNDKLDGRGTKGLWAPSESSPACHLTYTLTLRESSLTCTLIMRNTGSVAFPLQCLLHTYYEAHANSALDNTKCYVKGLQGYDKADKVDSSKDAPANTEESIVVQGETDLVFSPPADKPEMDATIALNRPSQTDIKCTAKGDADGSTAPVSCVVWNPHEAKAKAMGDFGDDQYHEMLCVEPGILGKPMLEPGKKAEFVMVIEVQI